MTLPNITMICDRCKAVREIDTIIFTTQGIEVACSVCDSIQFYKRMKNER
jgi:ribosomal protein L33